MKKDGLSDIGLLRKVGQLVMPRLDFRGSQPMILARQLVRDFGVGGFIIFGGDREKVKEATAELQSISEIPLFFSCDAERGVGQIISGMFVFPFNMSLGASRDTGLAYRLGAYIAEEMRSLGMNMLFAPVVDVNTNPDNPIINIRSFGDDPETVSNLGSAFVKGCQESGVMACAKHFPGHGGAGEDSHEALPVPDYTIEDLRQVHLIPFKGALESGVASVMTAHVAIPAITRGRLPATISENIVRGLLRDELGYEGLIITDSLRMAGIYRFGNDTDVAHLAFSAGCDIALDPKDPYTLLEGLTDMAETGELDKNIIVGSADRILSSKRKWLAGEYADTPDSPGEGQELRQEIAARSVCLLKGGALKSGRAVIHVFDLTQSEKPIASKFEECVSKSGIESKTVKMSLTGNINLLYDDSIEGVALICIVCSTVGAWKKSSALPEYLRGIVGMLGQAKTETVLVSFGSPYVVRGFDSFDTILCSFDSLDVCQIEAANVLLGKSSPLGTLPVKL